MPAEVLVEFPREDISKLRCRYVRVYNWWKQLK